MTDHDKLREAINSLGSACQKALVIGPAANRMTRTVWEDDLIRVLAAAESTLPRTKMVEVWRVEWASKMTSGKWQVHADHYWSSDTAKLRADMLRGVEENSSSDTFACIKVTGPHQQEVPA